MLLPKGAAPELIEAIRGFKRQALHAARLSFAHPVTGKPIANDSPLPDDLKVLLGVLARDAAATKKA
jgi:23S rRNA pseudouridine1911/1915/1917 synthase